MAGLDAHVEHLEPMRVAWVRAIGEQPELSAWQQLRRWAEQRGLLANKDPHPVYGFDYPAPKPGQTEYGYEMWMKVDAEERPTPEVQMKDFPGGEYAVTCCRIADDPGVPKTWKALLEWAQVNGYVWRSDEHELEHICDPDAPLDRMELELYLPIGR